MKEETAALSRGSLAKNSMPRTVPILFSWDLSGDDATFSNGNKAPIPKVEVLLYRARGVYDDRFGCVSGGEEGIRDRVMVIDLALAQRWMYERGQDGIIDNPKCKDAAMLKRVFLKQGTYVYLFRVNGSLKLRKEDKITKLATKRDVNFIDARSEVQEYCDKDVNKKKSIERSESTNLHLDNISSKVELFRAFSATKELYQLNMRVGGEAVSPLEKSIWNRVEKAMAARCNNNNE